MAGIQDVLRPITITKVVSRIAAATDPTLNWMGFEPGGRFERTVGGRDAAYDVFNNVRTVGLGTSPGAPASRRARNPIGRVPFTFPRMHESVFLLAEEISNLRRIGGPSAERDLTAQDFLRRQMIPPGQRAANFRLALMFGMLRDSLYVAVTGANWYFTYTAGGSLFRINFNIPTTNQAQAAIVDQNGTPVFGGNIIDVSWANPNANVPLHISNINSAQLAQYGGRIDHAICGSQMWNYIINNDYVAQQAGVANSPFDEYTRQTGEGPDGTPVNEFRGRIRALPWMEFHITDNGVLLGVPGSEVFTRHVGVNQCIFLPEPRQDMFEMLLGSEPIAEFDNGPWQTKIGLASWTKTVSNPTGWEIFTLDNALGVPYIPASIVPCTPVF